MKILVVCTGNICRSPLAEAVLRRLAEERGHEDVTVESAGTGAWDGAPASEGAYLVALEHGLDLSAHASRQLTHAMVDEADIVFGMSPPHVERALDLGGDGKAHLLGEFAGLRGPEAEVADPFGADLEEYRRTYDQLAELLAAALDRLFEDAD